MPDHVTNAAEEDGPGSEPAEEKRAPPADRKAIEGLFEQARKDQ